MHPDQPLPPWPELRRTWWVYGMAVALVGLHGLGLVVRVRCRVVGRCGLVWRFLDPDAVGSLPRLGTTALFAAAAVLAWRACRGTTGRPAVWWGAVAAAASGLTVLKLVSVHSAAKADSAVLTLLGSVLVAAVALSALGATGRWWGIPGYGAVVLAMAFYAAAAIGLDAVTGLVEAAQAHAGALSAAAATFVEELGEALCALVLLVTVRWQASRLVARPAEDPAPVVQSVRQQ